MNILLKKMSEKEFIIYFEDKIERYSKVQSDNVHEVSSEDPLSKARKQLNNLLPKGIETFNHHLFNIYEDDRLIGFIWIKVEKEKKSAFLYEIFIFEEYRGKGLGTKVMKNVEDWLEQEGIYYFKLHVFGRNEGARKLYEELGFEIAGINMLKTIN
ncbi:GNAT family N-acetyltransferase [Metabacillus halosaccharovorans]|uniref:GNAT family N-acetyltransferase n=1 Tax=Metabacillus halosaccharovorans TaxID=930124 RepID=A0ABT3DD38_9BACI|nr:GNAT family N-acetyltransferase [Metabacillus halosaccharovorans]MCV9884975.1 GNAT family N-acetyltransferase [Metabacillus halosaccharovorans]